MSLESRRSTRAAIGIGEALRELQELRDDVDPIMAPHAVLDPTNPRLIGNFIGIALLAQPRRPLDSIEPFYGSGIYAIYYKGRNPLYRKLSGGEHPIYVGKATPDDPMASTPREQRQKLFKRLREHQKTIAAVGDISPREFACRFLVVHTGWEASAEKFLIDMFQPVWNIVIRSFGNHNPGGGRPGMKVPPWDALHAGRSWSRVDDQSRRAARRDVANQLKNHLRDRKIFRSREQIMNEFFENLGQWRYHGRSR